MSILDGAQISLRRSNDSVTFAITSMTKFEEHLTPPFLEIVTVKVEVDTHVKDTEINVNTSLNRNKIISMAAAAVSSLEAADKGLQRLVQLIKQKEADGLEEIKGTARQLEDSRQ